MAAQLGINKRIISSDIRKMKYERDPELNRMYKKRDELTKANSQMYAKKQSTRFYDMTGMTFLEKTFQNMVNFYKPELRKVLESKNESNEISKLSRNIRKTLERNKIINHSWNKKYEITLEARNFLKNNTNK